MFKKIVSLLMVCMMLGGIFTGCTANPTNEKSFKASLSAELVTDEFASLPSGHSAYSMFAIFMFPVLADYLRGFKKFKPYLFVFGFLWWASTALSRLTVGAHYLTDITIAGLVTIIAYIIVSFAKRICLKRRASKR